MGILSDDLIEKAARAAAQHLGYEPDLHVRNGMKRWETFAGPVRAILTAALPDVLEMAAKVAEAEDPNDYGDFPEAAAARIRSLSQTKGGTNG